jgi:hypothetical protein
MAPLKRIHSPCGNKIRVLSGMLPIKTAKTNLKATGRLKQLRWDVIHSHCKVLCHFGSKAFLFNKGLV